MTDEERAYEEADAENKRLKACLREIVEGVRNTQLFWCNTDWLKAVDEGEKLLGIEP